MASIEVSIYISKHISGGLVFITKKKKKTIANGPRDPHNMPYTCSGFHVDSFSFFFHFHIVKHDFNYFRPMKNIFHINENFSFTTMRYSRNYIHLIHNLK